MSHSPINTLSFRSTEFTMRILERVLKTNIKVEGIENLTDNPRLYVINHFTRAETMIVPYLIYKYTSNYVHSLASHQLFNGRMGEFLNSIGVLSTKEPNRNKRIMGDLICNRSDWLIYPEGLMVKNKKNLSKKGKFVVDTIDFIRPPHTGGAMLALKAEIFKHQLLKAHEKGDSLQTEKIKERFNIGSVEELSKKSTVIVPVNVSYYPLRPGHNFIKAIVKKFIKNLSPRLEEELEIEGNLLLKNSDINVYFGQPINMAEHLRSFFFLTNRIIPILRSVDRPNFLLKMIAVKLTHKFMHEIYTNLEINIDHLFCSGLYQLKSVDICQADYYRALYLTAVEIKSEEKYRLHSSLGENLLSLLSDDEKSPVEEIRQLANSLRLVDCHDNQIHVNKHRLIMRHNFHTIRLKNPIRVIANELDPSRKIVKKLSQNVNLTQGKLQKRVFESLIQKDLDSFQSEYQKYYDPSKSKPKEIGSPFLLRSSKSSIGIVLSHGFLSAPEEIRPLAEYLNHLGYTVYGVRLSGHGTSPVNLTTSKWQDWYHSYLQGYAVLKNCCDHIILGGFSTGGLLALLTAATRPSKILGVFSINSPINLKYIRARRSLAVHFWNELLAKANVENGKIPCVETEPEYPDINYDILYVKGLIELKNVMDHCWSKLRELTAPALILQAEKDPTVNPLAAKKIFSRIKSRDKKLRYVDNDRHVVVRDNGSEQVFFLIHEFVKRISTEADTSR